MWDKIQGNIFLGHLPFPINDYFYKKNNMSNSNVYKNTDKVKAIAL